MIAVSLAVLFALTPAWGALPRVVLRPALAPVPFAPLPAAASPLALAPSAGLALAAPRASPLAPSVAAAAEARALLITTLSAPMPDAPAAADGASAAASERDFLARAQLGGAPADAPVSAAIDAPVSSPFASARAFFSGLTPSGKARKREASRAALRAQAEAARSLGADAVLAAYEDGSLASSAPELEAALSEAGESAMRAVLERVTFRATFLYGGLFGTHIYESDELPGLLLKVYKRPLDLLRVRSSAARGYELAKARLGGLFSETAIVPRVDVDVEGRRRRYGRVLVQQRAKTKDVADWGRRAQATVDAMERRGVRDADTGPRTGGYEYHLARNLGEAPDGSLVHFDADWFKTIKGATEPGRRVPDPEPLREAARGAQREALAELWR